jgi:hypothetical protein
MRMLAISVAAAATVLSLSASALPASAAGVRYPDESGTNFDLGVDVSQVPLTTQGVASYMASLAPETRSIIMTTCQNYVQNPIDARSLNTVDFCKVAVGG